MIEFFGMPAVGKTTLARRLAESLCARGHRAAFVTMDAPPDLNRYAKLVRHLVEIAPYLIQHPRESWRAVTLMRLFPPSTSLAAVSRLRYWWRTIALAERSTRTADITILDQGFLQGLFSWALSCARLDPSAIPAALRVVPRPQILIVLSAPEETIRARLRQRNYHHRRIDRLLLGDDRWLAASINIISLIEQSLSGIDCHVVRISSSQHDPAAAGLTEEVLAALPNSLPTQVRERS